MQHAAYPAARPVHPMRREKGRSFDFPGGVEGGGRAQLGSATSNPFSGCLRTRGEDAQELLRAVVQVGPHQHTTVAHADLPMRRGGARSVLMPSWQPGWHACGWPPAGSGGCCCSTAEAGWPCVLSFSCQEHGRVVRTAMCKGADSVNATAGAICYAYENNSAERVPVHYL